jgi:hypothetical protein
MDIKTLLDEYKEAGANMRHYANHFVAFLGLFLAFTGGVLSVLFRSDPAPSPTAVSLLQWFGLLVTIWFWVMTESTHYLWGCFIRRAAKIEEELKFEQYSNLPGYPKFKVRLVNNASSIMFLVATGYWTNHIFGKLTAIVVCFAGFLICIVLHFILPRPERGRHRKPPNDQRIESTGAREGGP